MTQSELYMTQGCCVGIAGMIIIIWSLVEIYGFRGKKRSTISEDKK